MGTRARAAPGHLPWVAVTSHLLRVFTMSLRAPYQTHATEGLKALGGVYAYVATSGLEKSLIDLAYLRASQINGCAYCVDLHARDAIRDGMAVEKLMLVSVWREAGAHFSDRERAALAWAESVTYVAATHVPDADYAAARAQFTEKELADLTLAVGLINAYNRMAITFRRGPDSALTAVTSAAPNRVLAPAGDSPRR